MPTKSAHKRRLRLGAVGLLVMLVMGVTLACAGIASVQRLSLEDVGTLFATGSG